MMSDSRLTTGQTPVELVKRSRWAIVIGAVSAPEAAQEGAGCAVTAITGIADRHAKEVFTVSCQALH